MNLFSNPYVKYALIGLYALLQAYFLGLTFAWILPMMPGLSWPYSLIPAYALGAALSCIITFVIFKTWQASDIKKVIVATILLVLIGLTSGIVALWMMQTIKTQAVEILGSIPIHWHI